MEESGRRNALLGGYRQSVPDDASHREGRRLGESDRQPARVGRPGPGA
jgi:hypothetical protein